MWKISQQVDKDSLGKTFPGDLGFGRHFASHMFLAEFDRKQGWLRPRIQAYDKFQLSPAATVLHYGQALFEGLKAFRQKDSSLAICRPEFNWKRMSEGAQRLCMEAPPLDLWNEALTSLLKLCDAEVPSVRGTSMYIRPTLIATESFLGVRPSDHYWFYIILSPVASYYSEGQNPVRIWVESDYIRAAPGGLGATKAAANYAGSLKAASEAKKKNFAQVLWLDVTKTYVQEVGTMNVFFVIDDEIVTPALDGCILEGGTREMAIKLLQQKGYQVTERPLKLSEIQLAAKEDRLQEAFGTGTAAVVSPIGELTGKTFQINLKKDNPIAKNLLDEITGIQYGEKPDLFGWMKAIK